VRKVRSIALAVWVVILAGCAGGSVASEPLATPSVSAPASASPSAAGPAELPAYHDGSPRTMPAGTYVTVLTPVPPVVGGSTGFFPGLGITIPDGWTATESDAGEISLHPLNRPNESLLLWKDLAAVVTNNREQTVGDVRDDIGRTSDALLEWLTTTTDFTILAQPEQVIVGDSIKGTQLTLGVSGTANFATDDCPDNPRCAAIFTDPKHWGNGFYAIGGDEVARIFIATAAFPDGDHTFFVTLDAPSQERLVKLAADSEPIIESLRLPASYVDT
jgi:hypothetical protein